MTGKKRSKPVTIRRGDAKVQIDLAPEDFTCLRKIADALSPVEIKPIEKQFAKLRKLGLVRHQFTGDEWPKAIAHLTQEGEQALSQEFA